MAPFRFPLERLLRLRQQQTQQAQYVLEQIIAQRRSTEDTLQRLQHRYEVAQTTNLHPGTFTAHQLQELWAYCHHLQQAIWQQQQRCERLRELERVQHGHLRSALQATELFQRLRDRYRELFRQWTARQEQRQLDEVAQRRQPPWPSASP